MKREEIDRLLALDDRKRDIQRHLTKYVPAKFFIAHRSNKPFDTELESIMEKEMELYKTKLQSLKGEFSPLECLPIIMNARSTDFSKSRCR